MRRELRKATAISTVGIAAAFVFTQMSEAEAHLVTTGLGPFYDGVAHLFLSPEDGVAVLALALFAGMSETATSRAVIIAAPIAWLFGGILGLHVPVLPLSPWLTIATFMVLGVLIATNFRLPRATSTTIAIAIGLAHGLMNGGTMTATSEPVTVLAGIVSSLFVSGAIVAAMVVSLHAPWTRVGVRVVGSWVAASGVLMLGFALKTIA